MKFITLNCFLSPWSPKRKIRLPLIAFSLIEQNPDIVFLQEIYFKSDAQFIVEKLSERGFKHHFYSKTLLIISKQPFLSQNFFEFMPHLSYHFFLIINEMRDWIYGKGFQAVEIQSGEQKITLVNLHLLSRTYERDDPVFWKERSHQLEYILSQVDRIDNIPVIMAGDYNFDKHSPPYDDFVKSSGFTNPLETIVGNTISSDNGNRKHFLFQKMNQCIDHFFVRGLENHNKSGGIIFREPHHSSGITINISDHYGLSLIIQ